jgi:hypothetical protein
VQMERVIANLLGNATVHPAGARPPHRAPARNAVTLSVADDGPGILPEERRASPSRTTAGRTRGIDGAGLGLFARARRRRSARRYDASPASSVKAPRSRSRFPSSRRPRSRPRSRPRRRPRASARPDAARPGSHRVRGWSAASAWDCS